MTTTWGTTEISLQCGIDVSESPSTVTKDTTSVTVTWTVYARTYYSFEDPQLLTLSNALSTTKSYYLSTPNYPAVTTYKIGSWTQSVAPSYSGSVTKTLVAGISGSWNGATPGHSRTVTISQRPPQLPSPPTVATATLSGTTIGAITWTRPSNASSASNIWTNVGIDVSVNGGTWSILTTLTGTATSYNHSSLAANTTYQYRVYGKNASGVSSYVYTATLQTTLPIPTAVTPASGASITVPNPTLGGTFSAIAGGTGKLEWQIASDNAFTTNLQTVTEANADLTASGTHTEAPTMDRLALTTGTWWIRAHVIDNDGLSGPFSTATSFTVTVPALPAPTTVTPASGATVTTMSPTLGATVVADTAGRQAKIEWQLATNSGFTANVKTVTESDVDFRASGATTETPTSAGFTLIPIVTTDLGTTWWIRAHAIGNDRSISAWTTGTSFTLSMAAPPVPTAITPATGGPVLATSTPVLGATLGAASESRLSKAEWQLATDAGFTTNLRTVTEANGDLRTSGATTESIPAASKLSQGTWYVRARAIDQYGQASAYSASQTFTVSHAPSALVRTPTNDITTLYDAAGVPFSWTFTDSSSSDSQSAYQVVVERNDSGAIVLDTGKITSANTTGTHVISGTYKDIKLRWKVRVWDQDNVAGAYSAYGLFTLSDLPIITITFPTEGQQVTSGQPTFTWTNDASTVQVIRQLIVTRTSDNVIVHDSGPTITTALAYTPSLVILENGGSYSVTIAVTDTVGMIGTATTNFTAQYVSPDAVTFLVDDATFDEQGYIYVDWSATTPDAFFIDWKVYRRPVLATQWEVIYQTTDPDIRNYYDWIVPSGEVYEYAVTQRGGRFGVIIESPIILTESVITNGTHYWILNPLDSTDNIRLYNVTNDSYSDDYEEAELVIIGRGRKVNQGTRIGYAGTLTCQLRDDDFGTAREKRIRLQTIKAARTTYYLRNPFGDLIEIALGNLGVSRIAGVGTAEFVDVSIPYKEVF